MKAMILAAGRGERMRPLTDHTPKPLLEVAGKALIEYHIEALVSAGIHDIVINLAYLGKQIQDFLGSGERYKANLQYSQEPESGFETAGGIFHALPLLGEQPFLVVNADIYCQYPFSHLITTQINLAHLVLVPNPSHHIQGDFHLNQQGIVSEQGIPKYTYSGIGLYHPDLFKSLSTGRYPLAPLLKHAMQEKSISGELYTEQWSDIGTPERLAALHKK